MNYARPYLEKYTGPGSRFNCPQCHKRKAFARYVNQESGEHYASHVGRCNRESKCGYHYPPRQYFLDNDIKPEPGHHTYQSSKPIPKVHIPLSVLKSSLKAYEQNNFILFLKSLFDENTVFDLINNYFIGSSRHWNNKGANVFWYINSDNNIRYGSIMLYNPATGKRRHEYNNQVASVLQKKGNTPDWVDNYQKQDKKIDCFFGEHLLRQYPEKPVAVCESEKTAIIASVYLPDFIWLAAGAKSWLTPDKCKILAGRNVTLYPDLGAFEVWKQIADNHRFMMSNILERIATDQQREEGLDIADWLIRFKQPQEPQEQLQPNTETWTRFDGVTVTNEINKHGYPAAWDQPAPDPLTRMKQKNPALNELIERFDLQLN